MKKIFRKKENTLLGLIIILCFVITLFNRNFLTLENFIDLVKSNTVLGIASLGMLLVIISGGIDVSVGSIIAVCTVITGNLLVKMQMSTFSAFLVSCAIGGAIGVMNGIIIAKIKIPPIVCTLGTMSIMNGALLYATAGKWINDIPEYFINFGNIKIIQVSENLGVPIQVLFLILSIILIWFLLKHTIVGRGIYAIGGDPISAERIGYNNDAITVMIYAISGFLAGLAATVHTSIMRQVDPNAFVGFELDVITVVVLGGASITGGNGNVWGTMLGLILSVVINNGMTLMKVPVFWQSIVIGSILLFTISFDMIQQKINQKNAVTVDID